MYNELEKSIVETVNCCTTEVIFHVIEVVLQKSRIVDNGEHCGLERHKYDIYQDSHRETVGCCNNLYETPGYIHHVVVERICESECCWLL